VAKLSVDIKSFPGKNPNPYEKWPHSDICCKCLISFSPLPSFCFSFYIRVSFFLLLSVLTSLSLCLYQPLSVSLSLSPFLNYLYLTLYKVFSLTPRSHNLSLLFVLLLSFSPYLYLFLSISYILPLFFFLSLFLSFLSLSHFLCVSISPVSFYLSLPLLFHVLSPSPPPTFKPCLSPSSLLSLSLTFSLSPLLLSLSSPFHLRLLNRS